MRKNIKNSGLITPGGNMAANFIERMKEKILSNKIDPSLYSKYNVKR